MRGWVGVLLVLGAGCVGLPDYPDATDCDGGVVGDLSTDGSRRHSICGVSFYTFEGTDRLVLADQSAIPADEWTFTAQDAGLRAVAGSDLVIGKAIALTPGKPIAALALLEPGKMTLTVCDETTSLSTTSIRLRVGSQEKDIRFDNVRPCPDAPPQDGALAHAQAAMQSLYDSTCRTIEELRDATGPLLLVDSSRDGGVWWYPQMPGAENRLAHHQGRLLADAFRASGWTVIELPREVWLGVELLSCFDAVLRPSVFHTSSYNDLETAAYQAFAASGGRLLLLGDHMQNVRSDPLAEAFGVQFQGVTNPLNPEVDFVDGHPIGAGVGTHEVPAGACVLKAPSHASTFAVYTAGVTCTVALEGDGDRRSVSAEIAGGTFPYGSGHILFFADTNLVEAVTVPLTGHLVDFARRSLPPEA